MGVVVAVHLLVVAVEEEDRRCLQEEGEGEGEVGGRERAGREEEREQWFGARLQKESLGRCYQWDPE